MANRPGALVISLDFELHWGVRDHVTRDDALYGRLPDARRAVADMLEVFSARHIRATWATVGFLFASTRDEVEAHLPRERPTYPRAELDPYVEAIGIDEEHDPEHLAGSLVELISGSAGQEVGSHTFSHYYCLEPGQSEATFRADLAAAQAIALRRGLELTSLVLPRNQWNPAYAAAVLDLGFRCIRGPQRSWGHRARHEWRPEHSAPRRQIGRHLCRRLASSHDGVERRPASVRPLRRARQRLPAPVRPRPQAPRTSAAGPAALGNAPRGAAWPDLPSVVAPAQFLAAPIRELRSARTGPRRVRPAGRRRRHAVADHGGRGGIGRASGTGPDQRSRVMFDALRLHAAGLIWRDLQGW